jgi:hypothetical protein
VQGDPYSPPCFVFSGDNGGATTRGVNGDRILVSVRLFEFPSFAGADEGPLAAFMFKKKQLEATISGLFDYFNTRFQPYGRRPAVRFGSFEASSKLKHWIQRPRIGLEVLTNRETGRTVMAPVQHSLNTPAGLSCEVNHDATAIGADGSSGLVAGSPRRDQGIG